MENSRNIVLSVPSERVASVLFPEAGRSSHGPTVESKEEDT